MRSQGKAKVATDKMSEVTFAVARIEKTLNKVEQMMKLTQASHSALQYEVDRIASQQEQLMKQFPTMPDASPMSKNKTKGSTKRPTLKTIPETV